MSHSTKTANLINKPQMVAGLAFLSKKGFNPANKSNQKSVWEARQQKVLDEEKAKDRADQLRRERDDEELARARGGTTGAAAATLKFMYAPPPGLEGSSEPTKRHSSDLTQRQPGDDDAAAAFREMLAAATAGTADDIQDPGSCEDLGLAFSNNRGAALQGSTVESSKKNEHMSALEKAVGKKTAQGLTLEEQVERFPQLKNAPMAKGMTETNVNVTFKPLGTQLRNVRCLSCGVWGHSRNDRECLVSGWDPFSRGPPSGANRLSCQPLTNDLENIEGASAKVEKLSHHDDQKVHKRSKKYKRRRCNSNSSTGDSDSSSLERRHRKRKKHDSKRQSKESRRRRNERSRSPEGDRGERKRHPDLDISKVD